MSLRSITTGVPDTTVWMDFPIIDRQSLSVIKCNKILPFDPSRIMLIGSVNQDNIEELAHEIRKNTKLLVDTISDPVRICKTFFSLRKDRLESTLSVPFLLLLGTSVKISKNHESVLYSVNSTLDDGKTKISSLVEGLGKRYGTEIRRFDSSQGVTKIAQKIFS